MFFISKIIVFCEVGNYAPFLGSNKMYQNFVTNFGEKNKIIFFLENHQKIKNSDKKKTGNN
jgi:hypothetical protein